LANTYDFHYLLKHFEALYTHTRFKQRVVRYGFCCLTQTSSAECPSVNRCFAPYLGTPSWWRGSSGDQALLVYAGFQMASLRRSQSQLDVLSAALLRACTELFLVLPLMFCIIYFNVNKINVHKENNCKQNVAYAGRLMIGKSNYVDIILSEKIKQIQFIGSYIFT